MSGAASKAVSRDVRLACMPVAARTPKGPGQAETPHPTSSLGHPLPSERAVVFRVRSSHPLIIALSLGRGGTARRWVRGLFPTLGIPQEAYFRNCKTSTATPADPRGLPTDFNFYPRHDNGGVELTRAKGQNVS
jgi:hypothetical protein